MHMCARIGSDPLNKKKDEGKQKERSKLAIANQHSFESTKPCQSTGNWHSSRNPARDLRCLKLLVASIATHSVVLVILPPFRFNWSRLVFLFFFKGLSNEKPIILVSKSIVFIYLNSRVVLTCPTTLLFFIYLKQNSPSLHQKDEPMLRFLSRFVFAFFIMFSSSLGTMRDLAELVRDREFQVG